MTKQDTASIEKFVVRLPNGMRRRIADVAKQYHRSMNSEIVSRLESSLDTENVDVYSNTLGVKERALAKSQPLSLRNKPDFNRLKEEEKYLIELILRLPLEKQKALISLLK